LVGMEKCCETAVEILAKLRKEAGLSTTEMISGLVSLNLQNRGSFVI